jgi:hypothetical protein
VESSWCRWWWSLISGKRKPPRKLVLTLTIKIPHTHKNAHIHTHTHTKLQLGEWLKCLKYLSTSILLIPDVIMSCLIMLRHLSSSCVMLSELCMADNLGLSNFTQWIQDVLGKDTTSLS